MMERAMKVFYKNFRLVAIWTGLSNGFGVGYILAAGSQDLKYGMLVGLSAVAGVWGIWNLIPKWDQWRFFGNK